MKEKRNRKQTTVDLYKPAKKTYTTKIIQYPSRGNTVPQASFTLLIKINIVTTSYNKL